MVDSTNVAAPQDLHSQTSCETIENFGMDCVVAIAHAEPPPSQFYRK
jgi:hypothetical protein